MPDTFELVTPDTLSITHIFDGEEVVTGAEDGEVWVATFASRIAAEHFVRYCVEQAKTFSGIRGDMWDSPVERTILV